MSDPREIVIASRNKGKLAEILQICHDLPVKWTSVADYPKAPEVVENGRTFAANAKKKAVAIAKFTKQWALADDSGLEVDALKGAPGIHSAYFAGKHGADHANNEKLLKELAKVPDEKRTARYRAVIVVASPDGEILAEADGQCEGVIGREYKGVSGFGYDPLFIVPEFSQTMAELGLEIKNRISHRAMALGRLREQMLPRLT
jgi:XTP/dITP diphosphohydrolase